ncbi:hypothetical protein TorRG33x02_311060 [Trema orientale]|uniref:Uncharacterized protein n=1 Tax=Trema orientale TaxID=63057 RepID=A0A2P5BRY1_TREOI|nr:hypothetical protein TorRG33x02_311060 [Trema orientale]
MLEIRNAQPTQSSEASNSTEFTAFGVEQPNILTDDEIYYKVVGPSHRSRHIKRKGQLPRLKASGETRATPSSSSSVDILTVVEIERKLAEVEEERRKDKEVFAESERGTNKA